MPNQHTHPRHNHGYRGTSIYRCWRNMKDRCTNPNNNSWHRYGGRGITVCERWNYFVNFIEDMGIPATSLQIDRIDNDKGYYKENCRWVSHKQNSRNKAGTVFLTYQGETKSLMDWAEYIGITGRDLRRRIYRGWPVERILNQRTRSELTSYMANRKVRVP